MWMSYFFHNRLLLNARLPLIGQKLKRAGKIMYRWTFDSPFLYWASEPPLFTKKHRMGMQPTWAFTRMWFLARGKLSHDGVCKPERTLESELALISFIGYSMRAHARSDRTLSFLEILGLGALADWADTPRATFKASEGRSILSRRLSESSSWVSPLFSLLIFLQH